MTVSQGQTDNWDDLKVNGSDGAVGDIGTIYEGRGEFVSDWVGLGDEFDYMKFSLDNDAKLSFSISANDAVKFTIYSLNSKIDKKGIVTYSLKSLQSSTLKKQQDGTYLIDTQDLLLQQGTYYIGVQSTNAKNGGYADYTVSLNESSKFFNHYEDYNDWTDVKYQGSNGTVGDIGTIYEGRGDVVSDWVGLGDEFDYMKFSLDNDAKLSFSISANDAVKFTIYSLNSKIDKKGIVTYSLKSLQSSTLKKQQDGTYLIDTQDLLLQQGTYYIGVQSTNAKNGGYADYTVSLNESSKFFNHYEDYNDCIRDAYDLGNLDFSDAPMSAGDYYVGLDDTVDFYRFTTGQDSNVTFSIHASDAVNFTVYRIVDGKLFTISSTTVKANSVATSEKVTLQAYGEYYFSVTSTNAAKGGYAEYTVYGCKFVEPLKLTVGGVSEDLFWDYDNLPATAKLDNIRGSANDDTITFAANKSRYYNRIDLGFGNDKLIFKKSSDDAWTYYNYDNDGVIDMGDGNNSIEIGARNLLFANEIIFGSGDDTMTLKEGDRLDDCEVMCNRVFFGNGNDTLSLSGGEINCHDGTLDFDGGNDYMKLGDESDIISREILFGEGNDRLVVNKDCEITLYGGDLDFGDGTDTLVLNGTLFLGSGSLRNIENVSGNGSVIFEQYNDNNADTFELLKAAGIDVINAANNSSFSTPKEELADNTRSKAQVIKDKGDFESIWLCSEQRANSIPYGFTDEVDFFKIIKSSEFEDIIGYIGIDGETEGLQIEILNSSGKHMADVELDEWGNFSLSNLKNGTYYLKFSVSGNCSATGSIGIGFEL